MPCAAGPGSGHYIHHPTGCGVGPLDVELVRGIEPLQPGEAVGGVREFPVKLGPQPGQHDLHPGIVRRVDMRRRGGTAGERQKGRQNDKTRARVHTPALAGTG